MYQFRSRPTTEWSVIYWICFVTDRPSRGRAAWFTNGFHLWDNNVHLHFLVGFFRFYYYFNFFSPRRLDFGVKIIQHTYLSIIHYSTSVTGPVDLSRGVRATVVATRVYAWNYPNIVLRPSVRPYVRTYVRVTTQSPSCCVVACAKTVNNVWRCASACVTLRLRRSPQPRRRTPGPGAAPAFLVATRRRFRDLAKSTMLFQTDENDYSVNTYV